MNEGFDPTEGAKPGEVNARAAETGGAFRAKMDAEFAQLKPEESGEKIGRYKLLQQIGEGGFGTVWMAEQSEPVKRRVALKIIKLGMDTKEVIARFEQERQALAMMNHPNIAHVLDAGATPFGRPFFVMELVQGVKITDYCDQAQLSVEQRLQLFIAVCHAVQHAHQKGVIHRDLKPSNIMVALHDGDPVPKVIDFGIAKAVQPQALTDRTLFTQREQMIGTPLYMSPEQAEMSGLDIDTRSDIYSLGVLLYELLTGRTPFDPAELLRQGQDEIRRVIREQEPSKPSLYLGTMDVGFRTTVAQRRHAESGRLMSQIRGDLDCIVMTALEKDRSRRYETANALALDIQRHLAHEPVLARPASRIYRFRRLVRRHTLAFSAAAAVALALIAGLSFSIWSFRREQEQRNIADLQRTEAESQRRIARSTALQASQKEAHARRLLYAADMILAQQALDEKNLGRAQRLVDRNRPLPGQEDLRGWEWRLLWQQCLGDGASPLTRRNERAFSVSFSGDGRRVAAGFYEGRVELWDVADRAQLRVLEENTGQRAHVAFSPVGDVLAATGADGEVKLHNLRQNRPAVIHVAPGVVRDLAFSADGAWLVVLSRHRENVPAAERGREAVEVLDSSNGRIICAHDLPPDGSMHFNNARLSPDRQRLYVTCGAFKTPTLRCMAVPDGRILWEKSGRGSGQPSDFGYSAMDLSPDGEVLATAMAYNSSRVQLWNAREGEPLRVLEGHTNWIGQLAFSRDGKVLASASADQTVRLWNTSTWQELGGGLRGHADEVHTVALTADGQTLVSGSKDGVVLLWNPSRRERFGGHERLPDDVSEAHALPGGRTVLVSDVEGRPRVLDLTTLRETSLPFVAAKFAPPNFIGVQEGPEAFALHEIAGEKVTRLATLPVEPLAKSEFAYNAAGRLLAWTPDGKAIRLTSLDRPTAYTEIPGDQPREPGRFPEDGRFLLTLTRTASNLRMGQIWNVASRQRNEAAERYLSPFSLPLCGRSRHSISSSSILSWLSVATGPSSMSGGPLPRSVPLQVREFTDRALSPDGRTFAISTQHGTATLLDAQAPEKLATLHGREAAVFSLAFSPDGTRLAMANDVLWDVATQQELLRLSAHGSLHYYAEFTDDGSTLIVGSPGVPGTFQFWRPPSWPEIAEIERKGPAWPPSVR